MPARAPSACRGLTVSPANYSVSPRLITELSEMTGNGSVTAAKGFGGVRPSPGAAMLESDGDVRESVAHA